ncbi:hypothetical protein [uncultured Jatrophihabitans sp.]|uniref:hypothetical protein n=1 Tax=uncultured Jatrophihabitans sp. TaxID=1610747 RepID=UPI0035CB0A90
MSEARPAGPPRRPWLFWPGLLVALAVIVSGTVVAAASYARTRGPAGAVRGYFEALQHADAAAALGFGDVPTGPRTLLTADVLREQQRVARMVDLHIGAARRSSSGGHSADRATVAVSYALRYPDRDSVVSVRVPVHESDGGWRLDATAVRTRLQLGSSTQRASVLGHELPAGAVLVFPGAPPVRLDTPYLALDADIGIVPNSTTARVFAVRVTSAGRAAMRVAVLAAVRRCLLHPTTTCPLPTERYLPASVRGTIAGEPSNVDVSQPFTQVGTLQLTASVPVLATSYGRLDFYNRLSTGRGRLTLTVRAVAVARPPLSVSWLAS